MIQGFIFVPFIIEGTDTKSEEKLILINIYELYCFEIQIGTKLDRCGLS